MNFLNGKNSSFGGALTQTNCWELSFLSLLPHVNGIKERRIWKACKVSEDIIHIEYICKKFFLSENFTISISVNSQLNVNAS